MDYILYIFEECNYGNDDKYVVNLILYGLYSLHVLVAPNEKIARES